MEFQENDLCRGSLGRNLPRENAMNFKLIIERSIDKSFYSCNLILTIGDFQIGDTVAWSHAGLVYFSVSELIDSISNQKIEPNLVAFTRTTEDTTLFDLMKNWQAGDFSSEQKIKIMDFSQDIKSFIALPLATEIFDGEYMYVILLEKDVAKIIWRDFSTKSIESKLISFNCYLNEWRKIELDIKSKISIVLSH